jgi:hypothetical protein
MQFVLRDRSIEFLGIPLRFEKSVTTDLLARKNNKTVGQTLGHRKYRHLVEILAQYPDCPKRRRGDFLFELKTAGNPLQALPQRTRRPFILPFLDQRCRSLQQDWNLLLRPQRLHQVRRKEYGQLRKTNKPGLWPNSSQELLSRWPVPRTATSMALLQTVRTESSFSSIQQTTTPRSNRLSEQ